MIASSATYPDNLESFLRNYMPSPLIISTTSTSVLKGIKQFVSIVEFNPYVPDQTKIKTDELIRILNVVPFTQCVIFANYIYRVENISSELKALGWSCEHIAAGQDQKERLKAIDSLKQFKCRILVTTDLTARGIDAENVDFVINYDIPSDLETYLHRMGRAGRYGSNGICITIAAKEFEILQYQIILGKIGTSFYVSKLPETEIPLDITQTDDTVFEKVYGIIEETLDLDSNESSQQICDNLKELSVSSKNVEESCSSEDDSKLSSDNSATNNTATEIDNKLKNETSMDLQETEEDVKNILESFRKEDKALNLNKLDPESVIKMLMKKLNKETLDKSKSKKVKCNEFPNTEHIQTEETVSTSSNMEFDNEAKIFQENTLNKNLALHNLAKLLVEDDSVTDDNIESVSSLLNCLKEEDKIKDVTPEHVRKLEDVMVLTKLDKSVLKHVPTNRSDSIKMDGFPQWETVRLCDIPEVQLEKCTCQENILINAYSFAISRTNTDWKDTLCELHPFVEKILNPPKSDDDKIIITKEEFLQVIDSSDEMEFADDEYDEQIADEEYYGEENTNKEYYDEENMDEEYYEEDNMDEEYYEDEENMDEEFYANSNGKEIYEEEEEACEDEQYYEVDEEMEEEQYYEADNAQENLNQSSNSECEKEVKVIWDEDLLIKAYDYALNSEIEWNSDTFNDSPNEEDDENLQEDSCEPFGYAVTHSYNHLQTNRTELDQVIETNSTQENDKKSVYESHFQHCSDSLFANAPKFTNIKKFELYFEQWQQSVKTVTGFVQRDIYTKEKSKAPHTNMNS